MASNPTWAHLFLTCMTSSSMTSGWTGFVWSPHMLQTSSFCWCPQPCSPDHPTLQGSLAATGALPPQH